MKTYTLGSGFVANHLPYPIISNRLSFTSESISKVIDSYKPDILINCIGKTGTPNIDWCESHKEETSLTNTILPILLAQECQKRSIYFINIGSGCLFSGDSLNIQHFNKSGIIPTHIPSGQFTDLFPFQTLDSGWKETDSANPQSYYSKTKYACDLILQDMPVLTLRIRMPISSQNSPRNLINKLSSYKEIINIPNSVTFMNDLQSCISFMIKNHHTGIFHITNPEPLTAVQIMKEYQKYKTDHVFDIITESQLNSLTIAKRSNCILNTDKLKNIGFSMTSSQIALEKTMKQYFEGE